jgi:hypothetical protein
MLNPDFKDMLSVFGEEEVEFLVIRNKEAVGRLRDLADVEELQRLRSE